MATRQIWFAVYDAVGDADPVLLRDGFRFEWEAINWLHDHVKSIGLAGYESTAVRGVSQMCEDGLLAEGAPYAYVVREHTFTWPSYSLN